MVVLLLRRSCVLFQFLSVFPCNETDSSKSRHNTNKTYFVSEIDRYTRLGSDLTSTPYRRNVDYRIRAYLEIYGILST